MNPYIEFTYKKYLNFKKAYLEALSESKIEFVFEKGTFITDYARYVVEMLDERYKHINESETKS